MQISFRFRMCHCIQEMVQTAKTIAAILCVGDGTDCRLDCSYVVCRIWNRLKIGLQIKIRIQGVSLHPGDGTDCKYICSYVVCRRWY